MKARKLLPLLLVSILTSCSTDYSDRIFAFDTYININIASKTQEVVGNVKDIIKRFDILSDNFPIHLVFLLKMYIVYSLI